MSMFVNTEPKAEKLKAYISSFTVSTDTASYPLTYTAFPNLGTCLAFFNKTSVRLDQNGLVLSSDIDKAPVITLLGRLLSPTQVTFMDQLEEISINFKSCGINYFFNRPFAEMAPNAHQVLTDPQWTEFAVRLYAEVPEKRLALLEAFLLTKIVSQNTNLLQRITKSAAGIEETTVQIQAEIACMSQRNFLRYFKAYIGCSPSSYKKILRFRSLLDSHYSNMTMSYTSILPGSEYYDAAHFRKDFIQFTGIAPTRFVKGSFLQGNGSSVFKSD